jgi:hypothetical protein
LSWIYCIFCLIIPTAFYKKSHKNQTHYQLWQEGCHPEIISTVGMMRQKIQYIHDNPVKRGYVDLSEHWRYSANQLLFRKSSIEMSISFGYRSILWLTPFYCLTLCSPENWECFLFWNQNFCLQIKK